MTSTLVWMFFVLVFIKSSHSELVYDWKEIDVEPIAIQNWRPTSFAVTKDKIFLTLVDVNKQTAGNGLVGYFNKTTTRKSPILKIYPTQNIYKRIRADVGKIITPISVRTDHCNRLWVLDSAVRNINKTQVKESPALYIFNLSTGQLIRHYSIPSSKLEQNTFFVNLVIDSSENACDNTFAYIADFNTFHLLIYDFKKNESNLISHHYFNPDPLVFIPDDFMFNIEHRDLNGLYGLALVKHLHEEPDRLYFHPLASRNEFSILTDKIKSNKLEYKDVNVLKNKGENTEAGVSVYDEDSEAIFFAEINTRKIGCLNLDFMKGSPSINNVYERLDAHIPEGFIVDLNVFNSELWILVRHNSKISIYKEDITELVKGTSCEVAKAASDSNSPIVLLVTLANVVALLFMRK